RRFLHSAGAATAALVLPRPSSAWAAADADGWRTFEVSTSIEVLKPTGTTRVWLPLPLMVDTAYQKTLGRTYQAEGGEARGGKDRGTGTNRLAAEWRAGVKPVLTLTSRVRTRNYTADLAGHVAAPADRTELDRCLQPTAFVPVDGIVKTTTDEVVKDAK